MRVLVLGAGGIGGFFGGRVAAAGVDVTFLVRPARAEQLARDGLSIISPLGDFQVPVKTALKVDRPFDLVLLACKAFDLGSAAASIAPAVGSSTIIVPLLNGLRHLGSLDSDFPSAHVLGGLCHIGVMLTPDGKIEHLNALQHFSLGARSPLQRSMAEAAHEVIARGGFSPALSQSILQDMWDKFVFLTAYAGITCLMKAPIGAIAGSGSGASIATELLEECVAVATAAGFPPRVHFVADSRNTLTDKESKGTSSMLRDVRRGARTEHDHILGDMLTRASLLGVPTPILRIADTALRVYEQTLPAPGIWGAA
jgi:2-dehydropantoate 2-reductase